MFYLVSASLIASSIIIAALGNESRKGLKRNWWAGLRTPTTMASDEAFRAANQKVWKLYFAMAAVLFIEGIGVAVLEYAKANNETLATFVLSSTFIVLLIARAQYVIGTRAAKSITF
ncbi:SdpI/YhfL protein family [Corynebacterium mustelae]|uniref:SdpI/YhfL protein family n=1 Tax=Corynebacterium mustelae TaxID=571915 RepID=A0A0G3H6C2_9CORY|nr:SdpI family protein [Corynebacterium mustelae]AKK06652.1 SdpI/YhfL protein family [Corynebacterium mustelae]